MLADSKSKFNMQQWRASKRDDTRNVFFYYHLFFLKYITNTLKINTFMVRINFT